MPIWSVFRMEANIHLIQMSSFPWNQMFILFMNCEQSIKPHNIFPVISSCGFPIYLTCRKKESLQLQQMNLSSTYASPVMAIYSSCRWPVFISISLVWFCLAFRHYPSSHIQACDIDSDLLENHWGILNLMKEHSKVITAKYFLFKTFQIYRFLSSEFQNAYRFIKFIYKCKKSFIVKTELEIFFLFTLVD